MTRLVLPGMKARKRGAIVNIGSAAATVAPSGPLYAVYAGTKARAASALPVCLLHGALWVRTACLQGCMQKMRRGMLVWTHREASAVLCAMQPPPVTS